MKISFDEVEGESVTSYDGPMLVTDSDTYTNSGKVWFIINKDCCVWMEDVELTVSFNELVKLYGPLKKYNGTVTIQN